jgi:hypothetical protein
MEDPRTLEALIERFKSTDDQDPVISEGDTFRIWRDELFIDGVDGPDPSGVGFRYADDLRIKIVEEGYSLRSRHHADDEATEWCDPVVLSDYDSLHGWIYEL